MSTLPLKESVAGDGDRSRVGTVYTAVWLLWAVLLFGGMAGTSVVDVLTTWQMTATRMASSVVLVVMGGMSFAAAKGRAERIVTGAITFGMALGTVGDFFNAGWMDRLIALENPVMGAIVSFGLGHLAYMAACLVVMRKLTLQTGKMIGAILAWQAIAVVAWYPVVYQGSVESAQALVWPALGYTCLLAGTAGLGTGVALHAKRTLWFAIGAALFLFSDLILAVRLFHGTEPLGRHGVWLFYGTGQMLIVVSAGAMAAVASGAPESRSDTTPTAAG